MSNIFVLNGHRAWPSAQDSLNTTGVQHAQGFSNTPDQEVRVRQVAGGHDAAQTIGTHEGIMPFAVNLLTTDVTHVAA